MNLVGHLVDFLWNGLSFWWVAMIDELRKKHSSGPKLIQPTPSHDDAAVFDEAIATDASDEEVIPSFDDYVYHIEDYEITQNSHPHIIQIPDCLASTGCISTDDFYTDERLMIDHYSLLTGKDWRVAYNETLDHNYISGDTFFWLPLTDPMAWGFFALMASAYLMAPFFEDTDIMGPIGTEVTIDTAVENGGDDGDDHDDNDISADVPITPEIKITPRKQVELSDLPSRDLSVIQDPTVLKYNGIPLHPIQQEDVDLINRSRVLESSPSHIQESPQLEERPSSVDSLPQNLSRLSDELEKAIHDFYPSSPIIMDDLSESISMTLDSANDLAMEAITQRVNTGYNGQFDNNNDHNEVKLLIKIAKVPRSRDLSVTAGVTTRKRGTLPSAVIHTSDLLQCPSETYFINSNFTNELQTCQTDYSTSTLQTCLTDYSTPNLQTCETDYNDDDQSTPFFNQNMISSEHEIFHDLDLLKLIDDIYSDSSNSGTLKNSNSGNTPTDMNDQDHKKLDFSDTSPYSLNSHTRVPFSSPSRIPIMSSPIKGQFGRLFKSSPVPKMKGTTNTPSYKISEAVERHFFSSASESTDACEAYLCELFGPDPEIDFDEKMIEVLTPSEIDDIISVFVGKETSQSWGARYKNLGVLIGHLRLHGPELYYDYFQEQIIQNLEDILLLVNTTRSKLTVKIIIFIRDLVFFGSDIALSNENFAILIHLLIPLTRSSQASRHIQNLTIKSLCLMLQSITTRSLLGNFDLIFKCILCEKKMKGEKYACFMMLKFYILYNKDKLSTMEIKQIVDKLAPLIPLLSVDSYQKTRSEVVEIYLILLRLSNDSERNIGLERYYNGLGSFLKSQVLQPVTSHEE